jgi:DNA-binding NtrC family response regulator
MCKDVLIIDNDRDFCLTFSGLLNEKGFKADYVLGGSEALELLENKEYAVIFCDMKMTGFGGPDIIREIGKASRAAGVIAITGSGDFDMVREAVKCGVKGCIYKPMHHSDIDRIISMYLGT